ncbi:MAG TPA: hypothetical protein VMT85_18035 [Thermoanaerobaculia bacterium]|nr:hypothetical protein [Thermoanaerobaculia bacterium]
MNEETLMRLDLWLDQTLDQRLDQQPDDCTADAEEAAPAGLSQALASSPLLAEEERSMRALFTQLREARVDVDADFTDRVMSALPRRRSLVSWAIAAALLLGFALGGAALLSASGLDGGSLGLFSALGDFVATSLLAGAGLLGATWSGIGTAVREWLGPSPLNWVIAAAVMLSLCLLLISLLRRRVPALQRSRSSRRDDVP